MELTTEQKKLVREGKAIEVLRGLHGKAGRISAIKAYQLQLSAERAAIIKQNRALNKWANKTFFGG